MPTCGQTVVQHLETHGVTHVFGIPGNHTLELYRGLEGSAVRHVTTRHEQGAAFMADGYARASGRPGVCFLISGPAAVVEGAEREMLAFETLTLAPIDRRAIVVGLLTAEERAWLDAYHARVAELIGPRLDADTRAWLEAATRPL